MSYASLEMDVIHWAESRGIIQHSNPLAQAEKTLEECGELLIACATGDKEAMIDAYGDILVTLIVGATTADLDLVACLESAYEQIKNRKGHLRADGVFVKEAEA